MTIPLSADIALTRDDYSKQTAETIWADFAAKEFWYHVIDIANPGEDADNSWREKGIIRSITALECIDKMKEWGRSCVNCPDGQISSGDLIERKLLDALGLEVWP